MFHFFSVPEKNMCVKNSYGWNIVTCIKTQIQASNAIKTDNRLFIFNKNFCRKTYGKAKCVLNPACVFDPTEDVDLDTGWTERACYIKVNVIQSDYTDQIRVTTVNVGLPLVQRKLHPMSWDTSTPNYVDNNSAPHSLIWPVVWLMPYETVMDWVRKCLNRKKLSRKCVLNVLIGIDEFTGLRSQNL
jgi:hypothetical protein